MDVTFQEAIFMTKIINTVLCQFLDSTSVVIFIMLCFTYELKFYGWKNVNFQTRTKSVTHIYTHTHKTGL